MEHSAILFTCIKQYTNVIGHKTNFSLLFEWSLKTGFTVVSVAEETGLSLGLSETPQTGFVVRPYVNGTYIFLQYLLHHLNCRTNS